ncbi:MAG: hypothetical protein V1793_00115 [Pseudomonadota bacterium]
MKFKTVLSMGLLVAIMSTLVGCVSTNQGPSIEMDEASLRLRVETEWTARVKGRWAAVYDLATADFRKENSRDLYGSNAKIKPKSFKIESVTVNAAEKTGIAEVSYTVQHMAFTFPFKSKGTWVWENKNWYLKIN